MYAPTSPETTRLPETTVVALLDALGARVENTEAAESLVRGFERVYEEAFRMVAVHTDALSQHYECSVSRPGLPAFGDSVLLVWPDEAVSVLEKLHSVGVWLAEMVWRGLEQDPPLLFRGAVGVGPAVAGKHVVLGPAVTDAAAWFEGADFVGIIASPRCGYALEREGGRGGQHGFAASFVRSEVPLAGGLGRRTLWTLAWPAHLMSQDGRPARDVRDRVACAFTRANIPPRDEPKYANTLRFVDECCERYRRLLLGVPPQPAKESDR